MAESGGIVLRGDDGSAYFIRDEMLAACKLEGEYLEAMKPLIDADGDDVEGFTLNFRPQRFDSIGNFAGNPNPSQPGGQKKAPKLDVGAMSQTTAMCPW